MWKAQFRAESAVEAPLRNRVDVSNRRMHDAETTEGAESCKQCTTLDWYKLRTGVNCNGGGARVKR